MISLTGSRLLAAILIAGTAILQISAQVPVTSAESRKIDELLRSEMDKLQIPGLSLVITRKGKVVKETYLGVADVELAVPVDERSAFAIASVSKTYTNAAIYLLAEQGRVGLDDSVRKYLPDAPESWQEITLQQLISHTSGLMDDWVLHDDWENTPKSIFARAQTNDEFLNALYDQPLLFRPGTSYRYACGAFVLGVVIEKVSGKTYPQFMREEIFEPLGLRETWVEDPSAIIPGRASGYLYENDKLANGFSLSAATLARGDVGIRASARDVAKWLDSLRRGKLVRDTGKLFGWASLNDGAFVARSGGGWFVWYTRGSKTIDHGGNYRTGFSSIVVEFVDAGFTVALLVNRADVSLYDTVQRIASILDKDLLAFAEMGPLPKPADAPTEMLARAVKAIGDRRFDPSVMHKKFPIRLYERLGSDYENVTGIDVFGRREISGKDRRILGEAIETMWFLRMEGERTRRTALYTGKDGKVLFAEIPEYQE